jgi:acyl carrier protein
MNLKEIMANVFHCNVEDIDNSAKINEVSGWDSLNHVVLIMRLNSEGHDIPAHMIAELTSYEAIADYIGEE